MLKFNTPIVPHILFSVEDICEKPKEPLQRLDHFLRKLSLKKKFLKFGSIYLPIIFLESPMNNIEEKKKERKLLT